MLGVLLTSGCSEGPRPQEAKEDPMSIAGEGMSPDDPHRGAMKNNEMPAISTEKDTLIDTLPRMKP